VIGRSITFTLALLILSRRERMLTRSFPGLRALWDSWKDILHVGIPSALTNILVPVGIGVITRIVSGYGAAAVAGFGVATRIETFALTPVMALRSVVAPFVGQNWGARRHDRLGRGVAISGGFSIAWGLMVWLILALTGRHIAAVFNDSPDVIATTSLYLLILPAAYGMRGVLYLSTGALSVLRKPVDAAVLMLLQVFVLYVPLAMLGSQLLELRGVFGAGLVANVVAGAVAYLWTRKVIALRHSEDLVGPVDVPVVEPSVGGI
jgi:Na+-driven multidrug efflux pump